LGAYLLAPDKAPAGTKRLSNLLRSERWCSDTLSHFLWQQAKARQQQLQSSGEQALVAWDASVLEKPESVAAEGLCPVRSQKAARLKRLKPGFYNPPAGPPVFVPGLHWVCLLVMGASGPPLVAAMRWFSTRANPSGSVPASDARKVQWDLLVQCARAFGRGVLHLFDRGFAGTPWLSALLETNTRFVLRWPKRYLLLSVRDEQVKPAWQVLRGQRSWEVRMVWDTNKRRLRQIGVVAAPVQHPHESAALWLVCARQDKGHEPWYLLTGEPITSAEEAWKVVLAYARRWQIEMAFRLGKSELAMESPRLWSWERRVKLLLMVTLAYAFLLSLLEESATWLRLWLLRHFCHRTGKRNRDASAPLYRLRWAISRLWQAHPEPALPILEQSSG
jgi:hypothetical protein